MVQRHLFWLVGLTVVAGATVFIALPFLTGRQSFYHDSLAHVTLLGLFYDRLFSGDSLLWSAALNGGHPLWVSIGGGSSSDPVVYAAAALGSDWFIPDHASVFVWLLVFALGGGLCAHFLTGNRWAALLAFAVLCAGPLALVLPAQSHGFPGPFKYFPLALYFYFRLRRRVSGPAGRAAGPPASRRFRPGGGRAWRAGHRPPVDGQIHRRDQLPERRAGDRQGRLPQRLPGPGMTDQCKGPAP